MEQGEEEQQQGQPPPSGSWPAWQQQPGSQPGAPPQQPQPQQQPYAGQQPPYAGQQPPYAGQPQPYAGYPQQYAGQTPYYGAPEVPAWPQPPTWSPQVKAPPGEHPKELPWRLAGWWSRVGAQLLDVLIVWIPGGGIISVLVVTAENSGGGTKQALLAATIVASFLVIAAHLFYAPLLMRRKGRHNGQTIGKQATGIRVIRADGDPMRFADAALRQIVIKSFGGIVASTFVPFFPWLLNYLWPTWDEQHRALHDLAANTRVVAA